MAFELYEMLFPCSHQQCQCFRQIAHMAVTLFHQPKRQLSEIAHPFTQFGSFCNSILSCIDLPSAQHIYRPTRFGCFCMSEIMLERKLTFACSGGLVQ